MERVSRVVFTYVAVDVKIFKVLLYSMSLATVPLLSVALHDSLLTVYLRLSPSKLM